MSEPCVCDLTLVMRTRLLFGLYNHRAVPPRWRPLARAYCLTFALAMSIYIYFTHTFWIPGFALYAIPSLYALYYLSIFVSLWTGDEYIYEFFYQNKLTDVTLESTMIFGRLQRQVGQAYYKSIAFYVVYWGLHAASFKGNSIDFVVLSLSTLADLMLAFSFATTNLIMALFDARLLVLKRRLQRYGFRTTGRAQPQPYCQIYDEILQGLDATDNPLKLLLFFDIICNCCKVIAAFSFYLFGVKWKNFNNIELLGYCIIVFATLIERLVFSFGYVAFLESAATHCQDMAVFTVTQLIKTPTAEERRRMHEFLNALERRGARYRVLRALPLDARYVLRALGFCTAQVIAIIATLTP